MKIKILLSKKTLFIAFVLLSLSGLSQNVVSYDISFTSTWNATDHGNLPNSPHWSDLVGTTHNNDARFWQLGMLATEGIKNIAEEGSNTNFETEVNASINKGDATQYLEAFFSPFAAISSATLSNIEVHRDNPLLTLASMIAPSPDWFIGIDSFSLLDNQGNWIAQENSISIDLFPMDSGTDSGASYNANNSPTTPAVTIANIGTQYGFNGSKIGTLTISYNGAILGTEDELANQKTPSIFPNPTKDILTIENLSNYNSIEMYNLIGQQQFKKRFNNVVSYSFNTSSYNNGLYFIKLTDKHNNSKISKVLLQ